MIASIPDLSNVTDPMEVAVLEAYFNGGLDAAVEEAGSRKVAVAILTSYNLVK